MYKSVTRYKFIFPEPEVISLATDLERSHYFSMLAGGDGLMYSTAPDWYQPSIDEFFEDDEPDEW